MSGSLRFESEKQKGREAPLSSWRPPDSHFSFPLQINIEEPAPGRSASSAVLPLPHPWPVPDASQKIHVIFIRLFLHAHTWKKEGWRPLGSGGGRANTAALTQLQWQLLLSFLLLPGFEQEAGKEHNRGYGGDERGGLEQRCSQPNPKQRRLIKAS